MLEESVRCPREDRGIGGDVYESMRRRALNAFTTDATCEKNHVWELLSGM